MSSHKCSRRGCGAPATWALRWRNPALHTGRQKVWLGCDEHIDFLKEFVELRDFPHQVISIDNFLAEESSAED